MEPSRVLITGTTSGVGRALLDHYAKRGASVVAVNRRDVPELEAEYPAVRFERVDVRDAEGVRELVERLAETGALPDVFLLSAGINRVDNDECFDLRAYQEVIDTNLHGVLSFVAPLTRLPAGRCPRHVVAISSLARYVGNPYALGYLTSKRALSACFEVWSRAYAGTDLVFQQVLLGPVPTAILTLDEHAPAWVAELRGWLSASLDGTARAIARFATTRRRKLFYPWRALPPYLGLWLAQALLPGCWPGRTTLAGRPRRNGGRRGGASERSRPGGREAASVGRDRADEG